MYFCCLFHEYMQTSNFMEEHFFYSWGNLPHNWPHLRRDMNMLRYYIISLGSPNPPSTWLMPTWVHLLYSTKCMKRHWSVTTWETEDHGGLVGEHFINARDPLLLLVTCIFNRPICEGFPTSWTKHTIVPNLKIGDPMMLRKYSTIMIGHYLAKLYRSLLESELCICAEREMASIQLDRQVFKRGSLLWIMYWPSKPLLRRSEPIIRRFIAAL